MSNFFNKLNSMPLWLASAILFALAFAQYANTLGHDYVWDDVIVIHGQENVQAGIKGIPKIFTEKPDKEASPELKDQYGYRPVLLSSLALDMQLFGMDPKMGHLMNVLYFALLCVLLFVALRKLLGYFDIPIAFLSVLLFLVHPIHVEAVANIKSRDEILALLFGVLVLLCAMRYVRAGAWAWLLAVAPLFAAAIWSKESIATFAIIVPCTVLVFKNAQRNHFFLLSLVMAVLAALTLPVSLVEKIASVPIIMAVNALAYGLYKEHITPIAWLKRLFAPLKNVGGAVGGFFTGLASLPRKIGGFATTHLSAQKIKQGGQLDLGGFPPYLNAMGALFLLILLALILVFDIKPLAFVLLLTLGLLYRLANNPSKSGVVILLALVVCLLAWSYHLPAMLQMGLVFIIFMVFHKKHFGLDNSIALIIAGLIMLSGLPLLLSISNIIPFVMITVAAAYLSTLGKPWWALGIVLGVVGIAGQVGVGKYWWALAPAMALLSVLLCVWVSGKKYLPVLGFLALAVGLTEAVVTPMASKTQAYAYNAGILMPPKHLQNTEMQGVPVRKHIEETPSKPLPDPPVKNDPNAFEEAPDHTAEFVPDAEVPFARIPNPVKSNEKGFYLEDKTMNNILFYADSKPKVLANGFMILLKYLKNFIVPYPLVYFYGYNQLPLTDWNDWRVMLSLLIHLLLLAYALLRFNKDKPAAYAILFYLASIAIYSHFLRILDDAMSDRYMFTASIGLCLLLVLWLARLFGYGKNVLAVKAKPKPEVSKKSTKAKPKHRPDTVKNTTNRANGQMFAFAGIFLLLLCTYASLTFFRNQVWKNNYTLFSTDIKHMENCSRAHFYLASSLFENYDAETDLKKKAEISNRLEHHLKRSIEITPQAFYSQYKLARLLILEKKYDEAYQVLQKTLSRYPNEAIANFNMGYYHFVRNEFEQALPYFEKTRQLAPEHEDLFVHLAWTYYYVGKPDEAVAFLKEGIKQQPDVLDFYGILSDIYLETGFAEEAMNCMKTVLQKDPNHEGAYHKLIQGLRDLGKEEEAYQYYLKAKSKGIIK